MVLVGALLASKCSNSSKLEQFKSSMVLDNNKELTREDYNKSVANSTISFSLLAIIILINVIPALLIANHCSKSPMNKFLNMTIALLFSDIYICYYAIRKYVYKDPKYCM